MKPTLLIMKIYLVKKNMKVIKHLKLETKNKIREEKVALFDCDF